MCLIVRDLQFEAFVNDGFNGVTTRDFRLDCAGERCAGDEGTRTGLERKESGVYVGPNIRHDNMLVPRRQRIFTYIVFETRPN